MNKKSKVPTQDLQHDSALALTYTVLLQAMKEDPPLDTKCRDKFLVQSVAITADKESDNVAAIVSAYLEGW